MHPLVLCTCLLLLFPWLVIGWYYILSCQHYVEYLTSSWSTNPFDEKFSFTLVQCSVVKQNVFPYDSFLVIYANFSVVNRTNFQMQGSLAYLLSNISCLFQFWHITYVELKLWVRITTPIWHLPKKFKIRNRVAEIKKKSCMTHYSNLIGLHQYMQGIFYQK